MLCVNSRSKDVIGQEREFPDLARLKYGLCYDRSRAIEVILRMKGFETRHASIYSLLEQTTALEALATPGTESHAVTEVKTSRGWMLVDSNQRWLGLSKNGRPLALSDLRQTLETKPTNVGRPMPTIYRGPFTWVYGLYSRHGQFYPPYTPVPDVNWSELTRNI